MTLPHVQTKQEIRQVLDALGTQPKHRLGQNFLIDGNIMRRLVDAAEIAPDDAVLEVGAGTGGLTDLLAVRAKRVIAVELDRDLAAHLGERFADAPHVHLLQADVLDTKNQINTNVIEAVESLAAEVPGAVHLVANLPYQIATPLLMNTFHQMPAVNRMCVTIQKEVADRIEAKPRTKEYGPLGVGMQALADVRRICNLPPTAFWPQPDVESAIIRVDRNCTQLATPEVAAAFLAFVRASFQHRRKTLRFNLGHALGKSIAADEWPKLDLGRRPEELTVVQWLELFRVMHSSAQ